jgi:hypothetical protein
LLLLLLLLLLCIAAACSQNGLGVRPERHRHTRRGGRRRAAHCKWPRSCRTVCLHISCRRRGRRRRLGTVALGATAIGVCSSGAAPSTWARGCCTCSTGCGTPAPPFLQSLQE